jgi:hypothetical protein
MHPLAIAAEIEASARTHAATRIAFMIVLRIAVGGADQVAGRNAIPDYKRRNA